MKVIITFFENYFVSRILFRLVFGNIVFPEVCQKQEIRCWWPFWFVWISRGFSLVLCHLKERGKQNKNINVYIFIEKHPQNSLI